MLGQLTLLWKSFLNHRAWFNSNISWVVGNGLKVNVLYDKWVPGLEYLSVLLKLGANKYFIKTDSNSGALFWDTDLIRCFLEEDIMQLMTSIPLGGLDMPRWQQNPTANCSLKDVYNSLQPIFGSSSTVEETSVVFLSHLRLGSSCPVCSVVAL